MKQVENQAEMKVKDLRGLGSGLASAVSFHFLLGINCFIHFILFSFVSF